MRTLHFFVSFVLLLLPNIIHAQVAISEVLWAGSDLSSTDEWFEIQNYTDSDVDLSGWSVTYLTSKGDEGLITRFATGTVLLGGEFMVVAKNHADSSRLLFEPTVVAPAMSLLNTKLLLTLKNNLGLSVDVVDDGVGAPFAGANPSSGMKASMERIDPTVPGNISTNWRTAIESRGLDPDALIFATPGFQTSSSSTASSESSSSSCTDPLQVQIYVQDGSLTGIDQTTVNFQAIATKGTIEKVECRWVFSDGYTSTSCNPPSHSFEKIGETIVHLEAINQCGNTLVQEMIVTLSSSKSDNNANSTNFVFNGSRLFLHAALPNPKSTDKEKEWIEIWNPEERSVSLEGWRLITGTTSLKSYVLHGSIGPRVKQRIYNSEISLNLPNGQSKITLRNPDGSDTSSIIWQKAEEGRIYYIDNLRTFDLSGTAEYVIDGDTFVLTLPSDVREIFGEDQIHVRLLGIDAPDLKEDRSNLYEYVTSTEFLRALIEKKKVDLEFDTEIWDGYGRLLAYVYDDREILVQEQLLNMGFSKVIEVFNFYRRESFLKSQEKAKNSFLGIWKKIEKTSDILHSNTLGKITHSTGVVLPAIRQCRSGEVFVSEVFSNPYSALEKSQKHECKILDCLSLTSEWIELLRIGDECSLDGWSISFQSQRKSINLSTMTFSGTLTVLSDAVASFDLRNAGGELTLWGPGNSLQYVLQYPPLKPGMSALFDGEELTCITSHATQNEQNICTNIVSKNRAKSKINKARKGTSTIAARYAPVFEREFTESLVQNTHIQYDSEPQGMPFFELLFYSVLGGFFSHSCFYLYARLIKIRK